jgi:hypothetical protein
MLQSPVRNSFIQQDVPHNSDTTVSRHDALHNYIELRNARVTDISGATKKPRTRASTGLPQIVLIAANRTDDTATIALDQRLQLCLVPENSYFVFAYRNSSGYGVANNRRDAYL